MDPQELADVYADCLRSAIENGDETWRQTPLHDLLDDICEKTGLCPVDRNSAYRCLDVAVARVKEETK